MTESLLLGLLNHLLAGQAWALHKLQPFSGQSFVLRAPPWQWRMQVGGDGAMVACRDADAPVAVEISLPARSPLALLTQREKLLSEAHISGNAQFAEALGFVFRHLRWDLEGDLAELVGDIPARRLAQGGQAAARIARDTGQRFSANLAEYLGEEAQLLVTRPHLQQFSQNLASLDGALQSLERRVAR